MEKNLKTKHQNKEVLNPRNLLHSMTLQQTEEISTQTHTKHTYMCVCIHMWIWIHVWTYRCVYVYTHTCVYLCAYQQFKVFGFIKFKERIVSFSEDACQLFIYNISRSVVFIENTDLVR